MNVSPFTLLIGVLLTLVQVLLAIPWVVAIWLSREDVANGWQKFKTAWRDRQTRWLIRQAAILVAVLVVPPVLALYVIPDRASLEVAGRAYAAVLQLQLTLDLFVLLFAVLILVWPKGGAVALAAFREGTRQSMFWLLFFLSVILMFVWIIVPYFTFGEDYLVVKQLGYDTIMLAAVLFGTLAASLSISEEIEGRTAITVMSKPVSRRQFMLGKFAGIALAGLFLFGLLAVDFQGVLMIKHWWDKIDDPNVKIETASNLQSRIGLVPIPAWALAKLDSGDLPSQVSDFLRGAVQWVAHAGDVLPGMVLCFSQVMVLVALAVALATRVPVVVNLVCILVVFFLANLTPTLLAVARRTSDEQQGSAVGRLLTFVAQVFDTVLPDLGAFTMDPALLSDAPPPEALFLRYVGSVTLYGVIYTAIVLLFGLLLFEDRDLA